MLSDWKAMLGIGGAARKAPEQRGSASQLALRLDRQLAKEDRGCSLYIAGADDDRAGAEACAELALNLAEEYGRSSLMVDGTFGGQGITSLLGNASSPGLIDLLQANELSAQMLRELTVATTNELVGWLPSGQRNNGHIAAAPSRRLTGFLEIAGQTADFVLVQGASVVAGGRSLAFVSLCEAALVVVIEGKTRVERIEQARDVLLDCGAERVGLVLAE